MDMTMPWFGPDDPVPLENIRQIIANMGQLGMSPTVNTP